MQTQLQQSNSNTTLVKVKSLLKSKVLILKTDSNTTLVKVKYKESEKQYRQKAIQIQLLLKLNARKINPYGFYYTIKSINGQGF